MHFHSIRSTGFPLIHCVTLAKIRLHHVRKRTLAIKKKRKKKRKNMYPGYDNASNCLTHHITLNLLAPIINSMITETP